MMKMEKAQKGPQKIPKKTPNPLKGGFTFLRTSGWKSSL